MLPNTDHENYNCVVTDELGRARKLYANWLHNNNLDHWQGWRCDAGATRFYIDENFNIWSGECKNQSLGNVLKTWDRVPESHCQRPRCTGCTDDLVTKKYQIE